MTPKLKQELHDNGAVCVRGALDSEWVTLLELGLERNRATPGPYTFRSHDKAPSPDFHIFYAPKVSTNARGDITEASSGGLSSRSPSPVMRYVRGKLSNNDQRC